MPVSGLAGAAVVPASIIHDLEAGVGAPSETNLAAIQAALERAGVEFIEGGVRVKKGR
jgi:hypothetical protein